MKLISMTSFVLEQNKILETYINHLRRPLFEKCVNYANFLKQPLNLGMFFPCDEDGNVLEKPIHKFITRESDTISFDNYSEKYQIAKEKVLFEGFYIERGSTDFDNMTTYLIHNYFGEIAFKKDWKDEWEFIEDLESLSNLNEIELTENAIKQIGL